MDEEKVMLCRIILLEFSNQLLYFLLTERSIIGTSIKGKFDCQNFDKQKIRLFDYSINSIIRLLSNYSIFYIRSKENLVPRIIISSF